MTERTVVDLYRDFCNELSLKETERRRFWFAISAEIARVQAALPDPENATTEEIVAACEQARVPLIQTLAARALATAAPAIERHGRAATDDDPRELLVRHWPDVGRVVSEARKRLGASEELADAVESRVKEKLFANDCQIIRNFKHQSSFRSYLKTIVVRTFADERVKRAGKWHASTAAERLGPLAIALEKLVYDQRYDVADAISVLLTSHPEMTRAVLQRLFAELPPRLPRPFEVGADEGAQAFAGVSPDILDFSGERRRVSQRVAAVLADFIEHLEDTDALLLQFLFEEDLPMSRIAPRLGKNQKSLYRRRDELFTQMRMALEKAGITHAEVTELYDTIAKTAVFALAKKKR